MLENGYIEKQRNNMVNNRGRKPPKPTRGDSVNIMRIYKDDNLSMLAKAANKTTDEVSEIIIKNALANKIIYNTSDNYGERFRNCIDVDASVFAIGSLLYMAGIPVVEPEHFEALLELLILGDGDCPECGGELKYVEATDFELVSRGDQYLIPDYYEAQAEIYECPECGARFKIGKTINMVKL